MKSLNKLKFAFPTKINRNMRCIEILLGDGIASLTEEINRNMRCIEMTEAEKAEAEAKEINRNMRCIEMVVKPVYKVCVV